MEMTKETKENLRNSVLEALKVSKKVQLLDRPEGIRYGEDEAVFRRDLDTYKGFSVGDLCSPIIPESLKITHEGLIDRCVIAAFIEMTGWVIGARKIRTRDIFCVLAYSPLDSPPPFEPQNWIARITMPPSCKTPILLFPVEKVKKLKQK